MALPQSTTLTLPTTLQDDPLDPTLAALSTLSLLNLRLARLEHLLAGHTALSSDHDALFVKSTTTKPLPSTSINKATTSTSKPQPKSTAATSKHSNTIPSQLHDLETRLLDLKRIDGLPGNLVRMVDTLRRENPDIFTTSFTTSTSTPTPTSPTTALSSHQATQVLAHASLYTSTSSRLQTLQTLRIPDAAVSVRLMEQAGYVKSLLERQERLEERAAELKGRSVTALRWWVDVGIKSMGELWEDWEDRVAVCERFVRAYERRMKEERGEMECEFEDGDG